MGLRNLFILWVFVLFIELYWFYYDYKTGASDNEFIYVTMVITLIVGITGLILYRKNEK